jgi:hypothetical protein
MRVAVASNDPNPRLRDAIVVVVGTAGLALAPILVHQTVGAEDWGRTRVVAWLVDMVLILAVVVALGHAIRGGWFGWLVNQENRMSLTRLQIVLWTTLTVAAVVVAGVTNLIGSASTGLSERAATAFDIVIPDQLWLLLGINVGSAAGTAILLGSKRREDPTPEALVRNGFTSETRAMVGGVEVPIAAARTVATGTQVADGILTKNVAPEQARFTDLFSGDELPNSPYLDIGKVQMFLFTAVAVLTYGLLVAAAFSAKAPEPFAFPTFNESLITLIAVSHVGYLANLAPNRTPTEN